MPKVARQQSANERNRKLDIDFSDQPVIARFVHAIRDGFRHPECNEIACYGTRGDGKTIGWMVGTLEHARRHSELGFALPVPWIAVTDTFTSHKIKTVRSFHNPIFKGGWKLSESDHVATFYNGQMPLVKVDLFGIEDPGAMDRVRLETVGVWFEEPAPSAVMVQSSGVSDSAWMLALTSRAQSRIPSHFYPAVCTLNYPDEDHWTWRHWQPTTLPVFRNPAKFKELLDAAEIDTPAEFYQYPEGTPISASMGHAGKTQWFRIPAGERATHDDRMSWAEALKSRPDMLKRLILGQPGSVSLGEEVAKGFREDVHVTTKEISLLPGEPIFLGFDFGHTPTCVIAQPLFVKGFQMLVVKAGLYLMGQGMKQLMDEKVMPWLAKYAPWTLRDVDSYLLCGYDPSGEKGEEADIDNSALQTIKDILNGGDFEPGPTIWEPRREALAGMLMRRNGLLIERNDFTVDLIRACSGRWYVAKSHQGELRSDKPKKPNHPWEDLGDSLIYCIIRYGVIAANDNRSDKIVLQSNVR